MPSTGLGIFTEPCIISGLLNTSSSPRPSLRCSPPLSGPGSRLSDVWLHLCLPEPSLVSVSGCLHPDFSDPSLKRRCSLYHSVVVSPSAHLPSSVQPWLAPQKLCCTHPSHASLDTCYESTGEVAVVRAGPWADRHCLLRGRAPS